MRVKFHGARGSFPTSTTPNRISEITRDVWEFARSRRLNSWNEIEVALKEEKHSLSQIYGGHTTCLELKSELAPMPLFLDAGTGLINAAYDRTSGLQSEDFQTGRGKAAFFFSHTHWDHISGLPTIPQIYQAGNEFHFYAVHKKLSSRLAVLFQEEFFPVPFAALEKNFRFHQIELHQPIQFGALNVQHHGQSHPGGSFAYRIFDGTKTIVFATDTELRNIEPPQMKPGANIYSNADVLILDAHFSPEDMRSSVGWGHANIHTAVDLAIREKTKRLYLFHQNPLYSDSEIDRQLKRAIEYQKRQYPDSRLEISMSIEGEEISV